MDRGSERQAAHTQQKLTLLPPPPPPPPSKRTTQIWVVTHHQYGIPALVSQTSFRRENTGGVVKCQLFFQAL